MLLRCTRIAADEGPLKMHWLVLSLSLYTLKFHNSPPRAANSATLPTDLSFHFPFLHCYCCSGRMATMNLCFCLLPSTGAGSRKKLPSAIVSPVYKGSLATGRQTMAPAGCSQHTPVRATSPIRVPLGAAPGHQPSHDRNCHLQLSQSCFKSKVSSKEPVWFCSQK